MSHPTDTTQGRPEQREEEDKSPMLRRVITSRQEAIEASVEARDEHLEMLRERDILPPSEEQQRQWWPLAYIHNDK